MGKFIAIAALMALCAAAAVAWPLIRERTSRTVGALTALAVLAAAAGLYPLWSNWDWNALPPASAAHAGGQAASPEVAAMVAFVCSPLASATNGAALRVDGGVIQAVV